MANLFPSSLRLLMWLLTRAAFRRLGSQARKPLGMMITAMMALMLLFGFGPSIWMAFSSHAPLQDSQNRIELTRSLFPLGMLGLVLLMIFGRAGAHSMELKPPELPFVLAGPYTNRQILTYRLATLTLAWLPTSIILSVICLPYATSLAGVFVAAFLTVMFSVLFGMALAVVETVPHRWISLALRFSIVGLTAVTAGRAAYAALTSGEEEVILAFAQAFRQDTIGQVLLFPFQGLAELLQVQPTWAHLGRSASIPLVSCGVLLAICYALPVSFTELAAAGIDRRQIRLAGAKAGVSTRGHDRPGKMRKARISVPDFPYLAGIGPLAWLQSVLIVRRFSRMLLPVLVILCVAAFTIRDKLSDGPAAMQATLEMAPFIAAGVVSYLGFLLISASQLGFSMPASQLVWLRMLAETPLKISIALTIGGTTLLWILRLTFAIPAAIISPQPWQLSVAVFVTGALFDAGLFSSLNVIAAWTELRMTSDGTPDVLQGGRAMLLMFLGVVTVLPMVLLGFLGAGIAGLLTGFRTIPCLWGATLGMAPGPPILIMLAALGFERHSQ